MGTESTVAPLEGTRTFAIKLVLVSVVVMWLLLAIALTGLFAFLFGEPLAWVAWLD